MAKFQSSLSAHTIFAPMTDKLVLSVKGMTCSSCAQGISRHLSKKGYSDVLVSFESGEVEVGLNEKQDVQKLIHEIDSLGYKADLPGSEKKRSTIWDQLSSLEFRFILSAVLTLPLLLHMIFDIEVLHHPLTQFILATPVLLIGWMHFGKSAWGSIRALQPNMDVLITLGSSSAYFYSLSDWIWKITDNSGSHLYFETSSTIITLLLLGNLIERKSLEKTQSALEELISNVPQQALKIADAMTDKENTHSVPASALQPNDLILVNAGSKIPADGLVYWGSGTVDESIMTGESLPVEKEENQKVMAGTMLLSGTVKIIVEQGGDSTILNQMIRSVKQSALKKPQIQRTGDQVSAWFVPIVIFISIGTFIYWILNNLPSDEALMRAVAVLVISCPCAMGLATPTAVAVAIGRASRNGVVVKGGDTLERLASSDTLIFDKTGTLTRGEPAISRIVYYSDEEYCRYLLGSLEQYSSHPLAQCIVNAYGQTTMPEAPRFLSIEEVPGKGIIALTNQKEEIKIGNAYFTGVNSNSGAQVYLCKDGVLLAEVWFEDPLRTDALTTFIYFKQKGIRTVILSGDQPERCISIGNQLGADLVYGGKTPMEKTDTVRAEQKSHRVVMVGDGINDASAMANAMVGVAMGSGTQLAMQTAEIVIIKRENPLAAITFTHKLSQITLKTIRQNLFWALLYNIIAIPMAAMGMLNPLLASFSMAFSDVVVIGNSLRIRLREI
jgi:Cu+-exporting ATPase